MTTTAPPNRVCTRCQRPLRGYFKIDHVATGGHTLITAHLCSITCVLPWAYDYGAMLGMMGVARVKGVAENICDMLRGLLTPP